MSIPNFMFDGVNILQRVREASNDDLVQVAYRLAETHPQLFCRLLTNDCTVDYVINGTLYGYLDVKISRKEMETLKGFNAGDKVRAIKWLRETYGIGLKEAKDLSEWLVRDGYLPHQEWVHNYQQSKDAHATSLGDILKAQIRANYDDDIPF